MMTVVMTLLMQTTKRYKGSVAKIQKVGHYFLARLPKSSGPPFGFWQHFLKAKALGG